MNSYNIRHRDIEKSYQRLNATNDLFKVFIKAFFKEDGSIDSKKARSRLFKEIGIKASYETINKALEDLRNVVYQNNTNLRTRSTEKSSIYTSNEETKVKTYHILLLKSYLTKYPSITSNQAKYRLQKETSLDVVVSTVKIYLSALRKILDWECINLGSYDFNYLARNRRVTRDKIKPYHIDILKKYLKEIRLITPAQARLQFRMETGLEVCVSTIRRYLSVLRIEIDNESNNCCPSNAVSNENVNQCMISNLNSSSVKILNNNLKKEKYIKPEDIKEKFHNYKGANMGLSAVKNYSEFANKVIPSQSDKTESNNSATKIRSYEKVNKIKQYHKEIIMNYLKEDKYISNAQAWDLFYKETRLKVSISSFKKNLSELRKEVFLKYKNHSLTRKVREATRKFINKSNINNKYTENLKNKSSRVVYK